MAQATGTLTSGTQHAGHLLRCAITTNSPLRCVAVCAHVPSLRWQHAVAGSIAGMAEHSMMFPMDTIKTLMQTRPRVSNLARESVSTMEPSAMMVISQLWSVHGTARFWRGVQTMFTGCVPAHGAYFTIYETAKPVLGRLLGPHSHRGNTASGSHSSALAAGGAVALGTVAHDVIMTPMDVCKQRLQLGVSS